MVRKVYERDTDALFLRLMREHRTFLDHISLSATGKRVPESATIMGQQRHLGCSGSIDIVVRYTGGEVLLIENKIDAGYSITAEGIGQPQRYQTTAAEYRRRGQNATTLLLAPSSYIIASRAAMLFDSRVAYEDLLPFLLEPDRKLLALAIAEAEAPYEPIPNLASQDFFVGTRAIFGRLYPTLYMKRDPNADGVRPDDSRTIYFEVSRTLCSHPGVGRPRMSLQCWDKSAPSASVKIMLGGMAQLTKQIQVPQSLGDIGGYLRPAGQSLGIVVDTPRLNTQSPIEQQLEYLIEALDAALRLQGWWNQSAQLLNEWTGQAANR